MGELGEILAESVPYEVNGKEYLFSKLNLGIMADFETAMQMRRIKQALKSLGDDATAQDRALVIRETQQGFGALSGFADLQTMTGMLTILRLCLVGQYEDITTEKVGRIFKGLDLMALEELVNILSDQPTVEPEEVEKETPKKARKAGVGQP